VAYPLIVPTVGGLLFCVVPPENFPHAIELLSLSTETLSPSTEETEENHLGRRDRTGATVDRRGRGTVDRQKRNRRRGTVEEEQTEGEPRRGTERNRRQEPLTEEEPSTEEGCRGSVDRRGLQRAAEEPSTEEGCRGLQRIHQQKRAVEDPSTEEGCRGKLSTEEGCRGIVCRRGLQRNWQKRAAEEPTTEEDWNRVAAQTAQEVRLIALSVPALWQPPPIKGSVFRGSFKLKVVANHLLKPLATQGLPKGAAPAEIRHKTAQSPQRSR
jgi:hypothetical protein